LKTQDGGCSKMATVPRWWMATIFKIEKSRYLHNPLAYYNKILHSDVHLASRTKLYLKTTSMVDNQYLEFQKTVVFMHTHIVKFCTTMHSVKIQKLST